MTVRHVCNRITSGQVHREDRHFKTLATNIRDNAKGKALLTALDRAFAELERLGAAKKAIIFTESKRTQEYLLSLLADTSYGEGIVLFNGTNSDARAQAVYKDWLKRHEGTDRITGSKTADTRAALVEHFKERGTVMIATEAGAEGINLQFCSLVTAQAFLADMLLILPMLGINAFTPPKQDDPSDQVQPVGSESDKFDTIVVPAREEGFKQRFLNEHCWFAVRINAKHISKLKFIAAYQVAPVAAIIH